MKQQKEVDIFERYYVGRSSGLGCIKCGGEWSKITPW